MKVSDIPKIYVMAYGRKSAVYLFLHWPLQQVSWYLGLDTMVTVCKPQFHVKLHAGEQA